MDYVCKVVGNLHIKDLNLILSNMEIIDLNSNDFKSSPQLRDCLIKKYIDIYLPAKYPNAKRLKNRESPIKRETANNNKEEVTKISNNLKEASDRLSTALLRIDTLMTSFQTSEIKIKYEENTGINNLLDKLTKLLETVENNKEKEENSRLDTLLDKFDILLSKNYNNTSIIKENIRTEQNREDAQEAVPIYVPKIDLDSVQSKSIKTQELSSEGTEDILEKLKKLKNKK